MPGVPFHYVDLRAFCYATEDPKRVERALRTFLPPDFEIEVQESEGYHGDRILVLSARVENADDVRHVLGVLGNLPGIERVLDELDERVNENTSLFLRLDKQAAYNREVERGEGITLRAKVEAYPAKKEIAVENAREGLEEHAVEDAIDLDEVGFEPVTYDDDAADESEEPSMDEPDEDIDHPDDS